MDISDLVYIDSTGYHYADFPTFLDWITGKYKGIYGQDVYLGDDSQDGQFLAILAQGFFDTAALGASVYNSFSPATAQGVGLSRNVKINGINRQTPSNSTVDVEVVGTAGTVITNGVVQDTLQQLWNLPSPITIPGGGSITVTAVAQDEGAINAATDSVNIIYTPTYGWQTVNNSAEATPGAPVESDAQLRARQAQSTANPSLTVIDGTTGGLENLPGVQKVQPYENDSGMTDGNGIPGHSIAMVVVGGDDVAICQEILLHKTPGCGTYGDTTELVYDAHGMPNNISFQRAVPATIDVTVTGGVGTGWSTDFIPLIQAAVAAVINSLDIGSVVNYTTLFIPAYLIGTPAYGTYSISGITIGKNGGGQSAANITLAWDENPACVAASDVTVNIT